MSSLEEFQQKTIVIQGERADILRQAYIDRFVDTESELYKTRIAVRRPFRDGLFYTGYLWECLKHSERIAEDQINDDRLLDKIVYVFWDLHSSEKIWIKDYWKFPKDAVLQLKYRDVLQGSQYLPEDIYIFDDSMEWSLIFTHETDLDNVRFYFRAIP